MSRDELKPCPMCGAHPILVAIPNGEWHPNGGGRYIECSKCGITTRILFPVMDGVDSLLAEQWNRRTSPATPTVSANGGSEELSEAILREWLCTAETYPPSDEVRRLDYKDFCELLRKALRASEHAGEAVAWEVFFVRQDSGNEDRLIVNKREDAEREVEPLLIRRIRPLYTHPHPAPSSTQPEPVSEERDLRIEAPISHEREPHCIGCWIVTYDERGLLATCNECGETRDLIAALRSQPGFAQGVPEGDGWIPVSERFPLPNELRDASIEGDSWIGSVLGYAPTLRTGQIDVAVAFKDQSQGILMQSVEVTHWQPLPEPPLAAAGGRDA